MISVTDAATAAIILVGMSSAAVIGQGSGRRNFEPRTATLTGTIILRAPVDEVFLLFSPLGETRWVEGWAPEILAPRGADWTKGMVFRTFSDGVEEIWVVAELDIPGHQVVYYRTEPGRLVARIEVRCRAIDERRTEASTVYSYVGLSEAGNAHVAEWTNDVYRSKMERWENAINAYLERVRP